VQKKTKIVITGAESTGKTTLTKKLAEEFNTLWLPEFAREYVERLDRKYTYNDVVRITKRQIEQEAIYINKVSDILFVDTSLIILKVWFDVVFNKKPDWLEKKIIETKADFYLLCNNDLEWIPDNVRENGGEMRNELFRIYLYELDKIKANYYVVRGMSEKRYLSAKIEVKNFITKKYQL